MSEPDANQNTPKDSGSKMSPRSTKSDIAAVVCSMLGCVGWIGLVPFLDSCDQGEQLARFFAVLFNEILIGVIGGLATILLLVGWWMSRRARRQGDLKLARIGKASSIVGLVIGGLVLLINLPTIASTLH